MPAGVATGLGVVAAFLISLNVIGLDVAEARTVATTALILIGLYLVIIIESQGSPVRVRWVVLMCGLLLVSYAVALGTPMFASFFELEQPNLAGFIAAVIGTLLATGGLWLTDHRFAPPSRRLQALADRIK